MGANIGTAQAVIADVTPQGDRARGMGLVGMAFGLGFVFGPAIGGFAVKVSPALPGLVAAGLSLVAFALGLLRPPRDAPREPPPAGRPGATFPLRAAIAGFRRPVVGPLLLVTLLNTTAFSNFEATFAQFARSRFGHDPSTVSWLFVLIGVTAAIVQGGLIRRLVPLLGEARLIGIGTTLLALSFAGLVLVPGHAGLDRARRDDRRGERPGEPRPRRAPLPLDGRRRAGGDPRCRPVPLLARSDPRPVLGRARLVQVGRRRSLRHRGAPRGRRRRRRPRRPEGRRVAGAERVVTRTPAILLRRDCPAVRVPSGEGTVLPEGAAVYLVQSLGGSFTVQAPTVGGLFRIAAGDADALGLDAPAVPAEPKAAAKGPASEDDVWRGAQAVLRPGDPGEHRRPRASSTT